MSRCANCYGSCAVGMCRMLSITQIQNPWSHLPEMGQYCPTCYQRLSYQGPTYRVKTHEISSCPDIDQAIDTRQEFLWDLSPFSTTLLIDWSLLVTPYVDDTDSLIHIMINMYRFGYREEDFNCVWDLIVPNQESDLIRLLKCVENLDPHLYGISLAHLRPNQEILQQLNQVNYRQYAFEDVCSYLRSEHTVPLLNYAKKSVEVWKQYSKLDLTMKQLDPVIESCYRNIREECLNNETEPLNDSLGHFWKKYCNRSLHY